MLRGCASLTRPVWCTVTPRVVLMRADTSDGREVRVCVMSYALTVCVSVCQMRRGGSVEGRSLQCIVSSGSSSIIIYSTSVALVWWYRTEATCVVTKLHRPTRMQAGVRGGTKMQAKGSRSFKSIKSQACRLVWQTRICMALDDETWRNNLLYCFAVAWCAHV